MLKVQRQGWLGLALIGSSSCFVVWFLFWGLVGFLFLVFYCFVCLLEKLDLAICTPVAPGTIESRLEAHWGLPATRLAPGSEKSFSNE